ncbi:cyclic lactone autoinducer peptide [Lachnospiraceae bacterium 3-1]|nr:cyclic lactone autoinducer peptide [Lachnospiraceae bacterium 3-1]
MKNKFMNICVEILSNLIFMMALTSISQCCQGRMYQPVVDGKLKEEIMNSKKRI